MQEQLKRRPQLRGLRDGYYSCDCDSWESLTQLAQQLTTQAVAAGQLREIDRRTIRLAMLQAPIAHELHDDYGPTLDARGCRQLAGLLSQWQEHHINGFSCCSDQELTELCSFLSACQGFIAEHNNWQPDSEQGA